MSFLNFKLSTPTAKEVLSLESIRKRAYVIIKDFIQSNGMAPDVITLIISCTYLQFGDLVKRAFIGAVDAMKDISGDKFSYYLPTIVTRLLVILDPMQDRGPMKLRIKCENALRPNIIPDTEATMTNINYQSIEPYFNKERLHFLAREFDPETNEMVVRWQFNGKTTINSVVTMKLSISNSGLRFEENHESEYGLSGSDDSFVIRGTGKQAAAELKSNVLHIKDIDYAETLLEGRYNFQRGYWEYRICSDNTTIRGEACYASDNYKPLDESMTITVEGIGLYLEPLGRPKTKK